MGVTVPVVDIGGIRIGLEGLDPGLEVAVRARYGRFLSGGAPAITLSLFVADELAHAPPDVPRVERTGERRYSLDYGALSARLDFEAGRGDATVLSTVYLVDSLLRITTTLAALERDALLVHGSGVRVGDRALVCFGPSGVGKTTVARSVPREQVLCDEMILLSAAGDQVLASGTPFHGDLPHCRSETLPLLRLVRLVQGERDLLVPLSGAEATRALLGSTLFFCPDDALAERLLGLAERICNGRTSRLTFQRETHVPSFVSTNLRRHALAPGAHAAPA
jgi:hypothetical protein